eukprot:9263145-Pyramimonas_sp.AAC.1
MLTVPRSLQSSNRTGPERALRWTAGPPAMAVCSSQPAWPLGTYCRSIAYAGETLWHSHVT